MRPINEIIVHCTATPEGRPVTVAEINSWHKARGWSGIGYHRVIGLNGERLAGRPIEQIGAHCEGHNTGTVGVVYVGGVAKDGKTPKDTRTPAQKTALLAELSELRDRFPITKISGHRDYAAKACPSFDATSEYRTLLLSETGDNETAIDLMLERGDSGPAVEEWRRQLAAYRKSIGWPYLAGDGDVFDHTLELITLWFQERRLIVRDGKVGPQTRYEMALALDGKPPFEALA
jgi:hypothetical protein